MSDAQARVEKVLRCPNRRCRGQELARSVASVQGRFLEIIPGRVGHQRKVEALLAEVENRYKVRPGVFSRSQHVKGTRLRILGEPPAWLSELSDGLWRPGNGHEMNVIWPGADDEPAACPRCHRLYRISLSAAGALRVVLDS